MESLASERSLGNFSVVTGGKTEHRGPDADVWEDEFVGVY